jgi:hypothetical protein
MAGITGTPVTSGTETARTWAGIIDNIIAVTGCTDAQGLQAARDGFMELLAYSDWSWLTPTATLSLSVASLGTVDAPATFDGLVTPFVYANDGDQWLPEIRQASVESIMEMRRDDSNTDEALYYAIAPKAFDSTVGQRWQFLFWPAPDEARTLSYSFRATLAEPTDSATYPPGGPQAAWTFEKVGLAHAELNVGKLVNGPLRQSADIALERLRMQDDSHHKTHSPISID